MASDSDSVWRKLACKDPYWAVISLPQYRGLSPSEDLKNELFQSGKDFIEYIFHTINLRFESARIETALDFGCGVGRLTRALLERDIAVTATDISQDMLDLCQENLKTETNNARFILADDKFLGLKDNSFDLCISTIVFQHITPDRGIKIFRRLSELVRPGGFMVHFFIFSEKVSGGKVEIGEGVERDIEMNEYDLNRLLAACAEFGSCVYTDLMRHGPHFGMNLFVQKKNS